MCRSADQITQAIKYDVADAYVQSNEDNAAITLNNLSCK